MYRLFKVICLILASVSITLAGTFTVTEIDGNGWWPTNVPGSFRTVISQVNSAGAGPHTIVFNVPDNSVILNNGAIIEMTASDVLLDGGGKNLTIENVSTSETAFKVSGNNNSIRNLTFVTKATQIGALSITGDGNILTDNKFPEGGLWLGEKSPTFDPANNNVLINTVSTTINGAVEINGNNNVLENFNIAGVFVIGSLNPDQNSNGNILRNSIIQGAKFKLNDERAFLMKGDNNIIESVEVIGGQGGLIRGFKNAFLNSTLHVNDLPNFLGAIYVYAGASENRIEGVKMTSSVTIAEAVLPPSTGPLDGIRIADGSNSNIVRNNNIDGFYNGIKTETTSEDNLIDSNVVYNSLIHGIFLLSNNNQVFENRLHNNGASGLSIYGSTGNQVFRNISYSNNYNGLAFEEGASFNVFRENILFDNSKGIEFWKSSNNEVYSNIIGVDTLGNEAKNGVGILVQGSSSNNIIGSITEGNIISNNSNGGIVVDGLTSDGNTIRGNNTSCNGAEGINLTNDGNDNYGVNKITINWGAFDVNTLSGKAPTVGAIIDIYIADTLCHTTCTADGNGVSAQPLAQGMVWVASVTAVSDGGSGAVWSYDISGTAPLRWDNAIVTATHPTNGNTSEFSVCEYDAPCQAPATVALSAADSSLCADQLPMTLTSTTDVTDYRYTWYRGATAVASGLNVTTIDVSVAGTYTLKVSDPLDTVACNLTSASLVVSLNPNPETLNFTLASDSICEGTSDVAFTVAPANANSTYEWKVDGVIQTVTSANVIVDLSALTSGNTYDVSVTETTEEGCVGATVTNPVEVNPLPVVIAIEEEDSICIGSEIIYTVTPVTAGSKYAWSTPLNATVSIGQTSPTVTVDFTSATAGTGNIVVTETNIHGCTNQDGVLAIEVFDNPDSPQLVGNFEPTCESAGNVYKISNYDAANTFVWSVPSGSVITTENADSIEVTFGNVDGNISVQAFSPANCESPITSEVIDLQSCNLKAFFDIIPDSVCIGEEVVITNQSTGDVISWTWDFDTAQVNTAAPELFDGEVAPAVTYITAGTKYISLTVNDGVNSRDTIFSVVVSPLPQPISIDGVTELCAESADISYSVIHELNNTYKWTATGADIVSESLVKDSVWVNFNATSPVTISVIKTNEFGCTDNATTEVIVNPNPVAPTLDDIEVCEGTLAYTVSTDAANVVCTWTVDPSVANITSGQGTNTIELDIANTSGEISLMVEDTAVKCSDISGGSTAFITVNPIPSGFSVQATDEKCTGETGIVYDVSGGAANSTYLWSYPTDNVTVTDDSTASITVDFGSEKDTLRFIVKELSNKGCLSDYEDTVVVILKTTPDQLTITGGDAGCNGGITEFSVAETVGSTYEWTVVPTSAQIVSGNSTNTIEVLFGTEGATVSVVETNSAGCVSLNPDSKSVSVVGALGDIVLSDGSLTVCDIRDTANSPVVLRFTASNATDYQRVGEGVSPVDAASFKQVDYNAFELAVDTLDGKPRYATFEITVEASNLCESKDSTFTITVEEAQTVEVSLSDNLLCLGESSFFTPSLNINDPRAQFVWTINGVQSEDTVGFVNLLFPEKDDTVKVRYINGPSVCVDYETSVLVDSAYSVVVSRPGALATAVDLETMERPRYEVNKTSLLQGGYFSSEDVLELDKIEDVFVLQENFDRTAVDYVFPKGKTESNLFYSWEWKLPLDHDSLYSDTAIINSNNSVALPSLIGRPERVIYKVSVYNGVCWDYDSVEVSFEFLPWPPNAFSPNSDGFFDTWEIRNVDKYPGTEVKIFNRWGVELLTIENYDQEDNWWDGTQDGNALPTGTYFYWIDFKDGADPVTGAVSIIK